MIRVICAICAWMVLACASAAEAVQSPKPAGFFTDRQPLFAARATPDDRSTDNTSTDNRPADNRPMSASLFIGDAEGGLFAALPGRLDAPLRRTGTKAARIRDLIARAEAGRKGYDAVQYGARIKPPKRPTDMTLAEIFDWIKATPGQPHAIGRYQFIPPTLRHSARRLGIPHSERFSPEIQDRLADLLLGDAGFTKVQNGKITEEAFMLNLAKIWAGFPTVSGRSYYEGYAGNKAVLSYEDYSRTIRGILGG